jgi:ADP-heptose:LPS heptosyltransferase
MLSVLSGARNRVGFYRGSARFKKGIYTHLTVFNPRAAIASVYRQLHLCIGGRADSPPVYGPIRVRAEDDESLQKTLQEHGMVLDRRFAVVNPNASDLLLERRWPTNKYVDLVTQLARKGTQVVLVGAKSETEYVQQIVGALPDDVRGRVLDTSGKLSLGALFALIKAAAVVVTNDTGPMHFSIALARPTVCLFGPVSPVHYGVHRSNVEMLYHAVYCSPCAHELDEPPCAGNNVCMQLITVSEVMAAVERQLSGKVALARVQAQPVRFAAPDGGALGVIVRASVETAKAPARVGVSLEEPSSAFSSGDAIAPPDP